MKTAMILAAGRGERLRPLSDVLHKSLCEVNGKALIEHHVHNLAKSGFSKIVINHAYLGDQLQNHLGDGSRWNVTILYAPEPPGGLETGGGIVNALPLLGEQPFITVNADIYTSFNFSSIDLPKERLAHLVLIDNPVHNREGDFGLDEDQLLVTHTKTYTFMGIACYHPAAFHHLPFARYSVIDGLIRPLVAKQQVSGEVFQGKWIDVGSLDRLKLAASL